LGWRRNARRSRRESDEQVVVFRDLRDLVGRIGDAQRLHPHPYPLPNLNPDVTRTPSLCSPPLTVVAASEVHLLEEAGVFAEFTKGSCIQISISYKGSVDIKNMVTAYGVNNRRDVDVFWAPVPLDFPALWSMPRPSL